ncbi:MAG: hypothetical protein ABL983_19125, partial [Nitrospira sp.]
MLNTCGEELEPKEQKSRRADGAKLERSGLCRAIAHRGLGPLDLNRLMLGRHALPEYPAYIALGGEAQDERQSLRGSALKAVRGQVLY